MNDSFFTIKESLKIELKEKKSIFLSEIFPVNSKTGVKVILADQKKLYYDANHICYSYITGVNSENYLYSDDGEPNGTAGVRIFNELKSRNLTNVLLTVTRYFGGVKFGVGPLGKAYSESARLVIESSEIVRNFITMTYLLSLTYDEYNKINKPLNKFIHSEQNILFTDKVEWMVSVVVSLAAGFEKFLDEFFLGRSVYKKAGL